MSGRWEHFHHGADIGVRGLGTTLEEAYGQAALALTAVVAEPALIVPRTRVAVGCAAPDRELLLVDWLNSVVYEMATRRMLFSRFRVAFDDDALSGAMWGEIVDVRRHQPAVEVKGATYTELEVAQGPDGSWQAQCVVDV
jgi:SHS2 domain-containing protein